MKIQYIQALIICGIIGLVLPVTLSAQWRSFNPNGSQPATDTSAALYNELLADQLSTETILDSQSEQTQMSIQAMASAIPNYSAGGYTGADGSSDDLRRFAQGFGSARNASGQLTTDAALRVYLWVKNNIRFMPYPGSKLGAHTTWIERAGNDFDTCALLKALLRECGYSSSDISYHFATVSVVNSHIHGNHYVQAYEWLGFNLSQFQAVKPLLEQSMYYFQSPYNLRAEFNDTTIYMPHVWVVLKIGSQEYVLDPSYKRHLSYTPLNINTNTAAYSKEELQAVAGGASSGNTYASGNISALDQKLSEYASNLDNHLRGIRHHLSGADVIGLPVPEVSHEMDLPTELPSGMSADKSTLQVWSGMPIACSVRLVLSATVATSDGKKNDGQITPYTSLLDGWTIKYGCETRVNGLYQYTKGYFQVGAFSKFYASSETRRSANINGHQPDGEAVITATFEYPHVIINGAPYSEPVDFSPVVRNSADTHLISYGLGRTGGRLKWFLSSRTSLGVDDLKFVIGMQYLVGCEVFAEILGGMSNSVVQNHHSVAVVSMKYTPSIDAAYNAVAISSRAGGLSHHDTRKLFLSMSYWGSAMEHICIEQSIQPKSAVSTVKLLKQSIESGQQIFLAKDATEFQSIMGQLTNYSEQQKQDFLDMFSKVDRLLIPLNGKTQIGQYKGHGYIKSESADISIGMIISGGLAGGMGSGTSFTQQNVIGLYNENPKKYTTTPAGRRLMLIQDPVDASNGSFYKHTTDLVLGDGAAPMGLAFTRYYSSARSSANVANLGRGWTHNYDIRLSFRHPTDLSLDLASASEVASIMIAAKAIYDLSHYEGDARDWVLPALVACWGSKQLIDSRASIAIGDRTMEFVKRADGSYAPPAGIDATLEAQGANLELVFYKGLKIVFPSAGGKFTSISDSMLGDAYKISANYSGELLSKLTDGYGRSIDFTYTSNLLSQIRDSGTRSVFYAWSTESGHNVLTVSGPDNTTQPVSKSYFDGSYKLTKIIDGENRPVIRNTYDSYGRVSHQYTFDEAERHWTINTVEGLTRTIDPYGHSRIYLFDKYGRLWAETDELGKTTITKYDGSNRITSIQSPEGRTVRYVYDEHHRMVEMIDPANTDYHIFPETNDNPTRTVRDGEGNLTTYTFNEKHQIICVTSPGGEECTLVYDARGRISQIHPAIYTSGTSIEYSYQDASNYGPQKITAKFPDSTYETTWLNTQGDVTQTIDRLFHRTTYTYDNRRQLRTVSRWSGTYAHGIQPASAPATALTTTITYDKAGDVATITDPGGKTVRYTCDALGNVLTVKDPSGTRIVENGYDYRNNLTVSYGAMDEETSWDYDAASRIKKITDPLKRTNKITYDSDGVPLSFTDAKNGTTSIKHDGLANPQIITDPDPAHKEIFLTYDKDSRQTGLLNRNEGLFSNTYDLETRAFTSKTALELETKVESNTRGLVSKVTSPSNRTFENTAFDDEGRVKTQVVKLGITTLATRYYKYLANGLASEVTEMINGQTRTTKRFYDDFDRLITYQDYLGATLNYTIKYAYDKSGNLSILTYPDGTTVSYTYDTNNRLKTVTADWNNWVTEYEYDKSGRPTKVIRQNQTVRNYAWDNAGQVRYIEERGPNNALIWMRSCAYDLNGNIENTMTWPIKDAAWSAPKDAMTYDADNRILSWNGTQIDVAHDDDGNMKRGPLPNGNIDTYTYDCYDRLTSTGGVSSSYNPDGLRISAGAATYVIDPGMNAPLVRQQGGTTTKYVWGLGLLHEDTSGTIKTYHADQLGSIVALTNSSGSVTDRWEYMSYGSSRRTVDGGTQTPFQFHGALGCMTDSNGLVYMRARFYNPRTLRFLNADPIGFAGGMNWYAFVGNNPLIGIDPEGLAWEITETQGLHYNNRQTRFGFKVEPDGNGGLRAVPLDGKSHTYNGKVADAMLRKALADPATVRTMSRMAKESFANPNFKNQEYLRALGRGIRTGHQSSGGIWNRTRPSRSAGTTGGSLTGFNIAILQMTIDAAREDWNEYQMELGEESLMRQPGRIYNHLSIAELELILKLEELEIYESSGISIRAGMSGRIAQKSTEFLKTTNNKTNDESSRK